MNKLKGNISDIKVNGALSQVTVELSKGNQLKAIVIESPDTAAYLRRDNPIYAIFKETEVILAKGDQKLSLLNKIHGTIAHIREGELLSEVSIKTESGQINAIISSEALQVLTLQASDKVVAMIKQNEIMLAE